VVKVAKDDVAHINNHM